jgi:hypothetical protein
MFQDLVSEIFSWLTEPVPERDAPVSQTGDSP